ncbi:MAG: thermonuclease family protein [Hyphomicrobiaceae bacterium]
MNPAKETLWPERRIRVASPAARVAAFVLSGISAATACELRPIGRHTVAAVVDAETLRLDDGREAALADVRAPRASDVATARQPTLSATAVAPSWPLERRVVEALAARLVGRTVVIATDGRSGARLVDRYGRLTVHVLAPEGAVKEGNGRNDGHWLQAALLADGLVRLGHAPGEAPCTARLLVHEQQARAARRGLWREAAYATRDAARPHLLRPLVGTLQTVEGVVARAGVTRTRIYLDFGKERGVDLTVVLRRSLARQLAAAGTDPAAFSGRRVRVTGWLEWRSGPWIEPADAAQLELLEESGSGEMAGARRPPGGTTNAQP